MKLIAQTLLVLALVALVGGSARAEQVDNPEYLSWSKFGVGSSVTADNIAIMAGTETKMVMTTTLKSKAEDKLVVSTAIVMHIAGNKIEQPATDREIPAKIDAPPKMEAPEGMAPKVETGEETLTIDGTEYACKWTKTTMEIGGNTTTNKAWTCDKIPGGLAKNEGGTEGQMKMGSKLIVTKVVIK